MKNKNFRIEKDSMGSVKVPENALYGAQTQRAIDNFPISGSLTIDFIYAVVIIKRSAAIVNCQLNLIDQDVKDAIVNAADKVLSGDYNEHFPVDIFQTGSGTSTNMNVNEVLANLSNENRKNKIHPNDHINMGQSSNDTIPTAINVATALKTMKTYVD